MEKLIHLIWDRPSRPGDERRGELLDEIAPGLQELGVQRLEGFVRDLDVDGPMPATGTELPLGTALTFWVDRYDSDLAENATAALATRGVRSAAYLVTESTWTEYGDNERRGPRDWPAGSRSPGVTTFTTLFRNPQLDARTFREFWHGHQSPMSDRVQPRWRYLRHTVVHPITPGAPPYDAIVHESWPDAGLLTDIVAFHNGDAENLRIMMDSVTTAFELDRLRSEAMSEYLFWNEHSR